MIMFGECHAHLLMDGVNYKKAVELHKDSVNDADIRAKFSEYAKREIFYVRDGGDSYGVSQPGRRIWQGNMGLRTARRSLPSTKRGIMEVS